MTTRKEFAELRAVIDAALGSANNGNLNKFVAEQVIAAGFGKKETAWQEGWKHYREFYNPHFTEFGVNPYTVKDSK